MRPLRHNAQAMSNNVDPVRSIYTDWERGDFRFTAWADPKIEFVIADGPARGNWTEVAQMATGWRNLLGSWADCRVVAEEAIRALDDERVLVLNHLSGSARSSGVDVGQMRTEGAQLFHVKRGKVTSNVCYADRDGALADLGLKE